MPNQAHVTICSGVKSIIDQEGSVLLDLRAGHYYSLNAVGACIWEHLELGLDFLEIEGVIAAKYEADPDRIHTDVSRFIALLAEKGVVVWS
jgi:hypothetical protein